MPNSIEDATRICGGSEESRFIKEISKTRGDHEGVDPALTQVLLVIILFDVYSIGSLAMQGKASRGDARDAYGIDIQACGLSL